MRCFCAETPLAAGSSGAALSAAALAPWATGVERRCLEGMVKSDASVSGAVRENPSNIGRGQRGLDQQSHLAEQHRLATRALRHSRICKKRPDDLQHIQGSPARARWRALLRGG